MLNIKIIVNLQDDLWLLLPPILMDKSKAVSSYPEFISYTIAIIMLFPFKGIFIMYFMYLCIFMF